MTVGTIHFGHCRYKVTDLSAAKRFYSKSIGLKPYFDEPTWVIFEINNFQLWLEPDNLTEESIYESTNPLYYESSKHTKLTFWAVADVQETCNRFKELGGTIFKTPKKDGPFTYAIVKDPWGKNWDCIPIHLQSLFKPVFW
jgi:predicted enzyme related to lactoylglutathione lyase